MEVRAHLRFLRIAPRKVRLVINLIRGLHVDQAVDQLAVLPKRSALPILKLLHSAIANAEHNFQLVRKDLRIKSIVANEGPRLKRYQPRAFGRAGEILKRMTHVTIVLEDLAKSVPKQHQPQKVTTTKAMSDMLKQESSTAKTAPVPAMKPNKKTTATSTAKSKAHDAQDVTIRRQGKS